MRGSLSILGFSNRVLVITKANGRADMLCGGDRSKCEQSYGADGSMRNLNQGLAYQRSDNELSDVLKQGWRG